MAEHIPVPVPDGDTRPFWDGVAQHKLMIQRCDSCRQFVFYPRSICPHCFSDTLSWVEAQGTGTIYSYTVVHRAFGPFAGQTPFVVAIVELAEGVRMMTRISGSAPDAVRIGAQVQVVFVEADEGVTLPYFQLLSS